MLVRVVRSGAVRAPWRARCGQLTRARQAPPCRGRRRSGFALPPPALTDLRILHGSCRRPGFIYPDDTEGTKSFDGPAWVDDLILEWRRRDADVVSARPERAAAPALLHRRPDLRGRRRDAAPADAQQGVGNRLLDSPEGAGEGSSGLRFDRLEEA
jgi:hypothetical protein